MKDWKSKAYVDELYPEKKKCSPSIRNKKASEFFAFSCYKMQMRMKIPFRVLLISI
jgi:hypothetical protein